ncbi:ComEC/Rec2 family competence protein [Kitasatospora azatica]|uniref:ComEC/Rec2 family competence protein n=1 Tax=Kitasatospora azatica TaxID=58347 RepID=UPI000560E2D7|nr:ComEC/Rec2 family competence protein [Kitasatospora azatica]
MPTPQPHRADATPTTPDLRLLLPTLGAWCTTALLLDLAPRHTPVVLLAATAAALTAGALLLANQRHSRHGLTLLAATLLTLAAASTCTVLHTADLHRGPLPALAHPATDSAGATIVTVDLTITGDPHTRTSHSRGSNPGHPLLTLDATADRVTAPARTAIRTHTPVTVIVQERDVPAWQPMLPSTRVTAQVQVLPARADSADTGAVLLAQGAPRQLAPPSWAQRLAGRLRAGLRRACAGLSPDARALLPGLVVGDTSAMPEDLEEAFHATDLVHLTAVSGANLSIVLAVLLGAPALAGSAERGGLAALLGVPLRLAALLGAALTLAFVTLCRPDPSVLRAAATGLLSLLALASGRPRHAFSALAAGVLALLLLDPFLARSYGFLLSVLATAGLLTLGRRWSKALRERGWPHHLADALAGAAAAQALCTPATVLLAPRVSLVGVPCNLLAELAVAPATLLGFATLAVAPLSASLARFVAGLAALPTEWLAKVARSGAALPGAELAWTPGWLGSVMLAAGILAACCAAPLFLAAKPSDLTVDQLPTSRRSRARFVLAALLALTLLLLLLRPPGVVRIATGWPPLGARLVMCSVGQGDLLALPVPNAPDTAVVVDAGPDPAAADACLRDLGITRVALLLLTHFHADHIEGVPGVLRHRTVGAIETTTLNSPPGESAKVTGWAAAAHIPLLRAAPREHRTAAPDLSWDVLWPAGPLGPDTPGPNNASLSLLVTAGTLRFALLGDLEPPAQAELLAHGHPGRVDVLKVAHHGSANQDWTLTQALRPRLALISVGADNSYGHPSPRTVDHLRALGTTVLRTDQSGDIAILGDTPATLHALTRRDSEGR